MKCQVAKDEPAAAELVRDAGFSIVPRTDIWETTDAFHLEAEVPGVDDKGIDVKVEDGTLSLVGRLASHGHDGSRKAYSEYEEGNFQRSFKLSRDVDQEKIEARLAHGVLHLTLPKREAVKPKRIAVKAS